MSRYGWVCCAVACIAWIGIGCDRATPSAKARAASATKPALVIQPGKYMGENLTLILDDDGAGAVTFAEKTYPITTNSQSPGLWQGTFSSDGKFFNWTATADGESLLFKTADAEYRLHRVIEEAENPLARKKATSMLAQAATTRSSEPADPTKQMKFTRLSIKDPGVNNIEAISFLIPEGWKPLGGIKWFPDYSILANLLLKITDPQTGAQIEFLPTQNFTYLMNPIVPMQRGSNYIGNIVWEPVENAADIVQTFYVDKVTPQLKGLTPVKQESLDKIAKQVVQSYGGQTQARATRLRYQYDLKGKPWDEDVYITAVYTPWQMGTLWSVTSAYAFRAPRTAQVDLDKLTPLMNTTVTSARLSQDWFSGYSYVQKLFNDRMAQGIRNAQALSDTITQNSDQIRQMFADSYRQRSESQDRINEQFSEYIRGVETYRNPYEDRPVQLPSGYRDAWVNSSGEYILSEQAGFDPNVGSTSEWRRMEVNHR